MRIIILCALLFCESVSFAMGVLWAGEIRGDLTGNMPTFRVDVSKMPMPRQVELVRELEKSGAVCQAHGGHSWPPEEREVQDLTVVDVRRPGETASPFFMRRVAPSPERCCSVCKKVERRDVVPEKVGEWK